MRSFLFKIILLALISITIFGIRAMLVKSDKLLFVSNSVSYNTKARFILDHSEKLRQTNIFVAGSSMSLNNVDAELIATELQQSVLNISAWSMKVADFRSVPFLVNPKNQILINMSFPDFGSSETLQYGGYPYNDKYELLTIMGNFKTYETQVQLAFQYTSPEAISDYTYLNFDPSGSVILQKNKLNIKKERWEKKIPTPDRAAMLAFEHDLNYLKECPHVFIFFSPERRAFKEETRRQFVKQLEAAVTASYPSIQFFNNYDLDFEDSLFVDGYHFNELGCKQYTDIMLQQMKMNGGSR